MEVLVINGHDYSRYVERKGLGWSRNDLDSKKTARPKNGRLRRDKITTKRKLLFTVFHMTQDQLAQLAQLDNDLSEDTFRATYLDLHGVQSREFYCSAFNANLDAVRGEAGVWTDGTFNMIEV